MIQVEEKEKEERKTKQSFEVVQVLPSILNI
jgi:hypothetical protein